jgi:transposase
MLGVETIDKIRKALSKGMSLREAARRFCKSRNTIRKIRDTWETKFEYHRKKRHFPVAGDYLSALHDMLEANEANPKRFRRNILSLFEELQGRGYTGSYSTILRHASKWRVNRGSVNNVFIPLSFRPGEAFQFDWSEEWVELGGWEQKVYLAHFRLCNSRMSYLRAYPLQRLEMVLDAHGKAHDFFGGLCERGIYDNLSTVVKQILKGKDRKYNPRFVECSSHYLFEPTACTPGAGWEKGGVENQVQTMRDKYFKPMLRFANFEELNQYLEERVIARAKSSPHPEMHDRTVYSVFEEEKKFLIQAVFPFDACTKTETSINSESLATFDHNRYSVPCEYAHKQVSRRVYADKVCFYASGECISSHKRSFERDKTFCDPLHYLRVLERKPGALRNGVPFQNWALPLGLQMARERLERIPGGDKQFAGIAAAIPIYGAEAVGTACELALEAGMSSKEAVLNILNRVTEDLPPPLMDFSAYLSLRNPPKADCKNYESLLEASHDA